VIVRNTSSCEREEDTRMNEDDDGNAEDSVRQREQRVQLLRQPVDTTDAVREGNQDQMHHYFLTNYSLKSFPRLL
jgi:hypothetical protein